MSNTGGCGRSARGQLVQGQMNTNDGRNCRAICRGGVINHDGGVDRVDTSCRRCASR